MRISNFLALVDSVGIILLAALFYIAFHEQYQIIALVALGFYLAESITLAVGMLGGYAPISLSQEFVEAGAPEPPHFQALCDFLYHGVGRQGEPHAQFVLLPGWDTRVFSTSVFKVYPTYRPGTL